MMEDGITLVLREHRIEVNKGKLANKSRYFASLFSHNFNDSHSKEHILNYDIDLCTLQNFVNWISNESYQEIGHYNIKDFMTKFLEKNFAELLNLLQLSVLFMVDELTHDIVEVIVYCWLLPDTVIDVWLLAQELNVKILQDICFSFCLDRFEELPISSLIELTKDNIIKLVGNVNVRSGTKYLCCVRTEWTKHNTVSEIPNIKTERQPKFIHGTLILETNKDNVDVTNVYTWRDNVLSKCVELKNIQEPNFKVRGFQGLIGMQIASRGFNIYTVGGEIGLGIGQFNEIILRYCLLFKKWFYLTRLPSPRRHMVTVFLKNKLVVAGGVGKHRLKLFTVDIFNIHTGKWEIGAKVPESFTDVPPHCVLGGKLFLMKSFLYIYDPDSNHWQTVSISNNFAVQSVDALLTDATALSFIGNYKGETVVSKVEIVNGTICEKEECSKGFIERVVIDDIDIVHEDDSCRLRYVKVADVGIMIVNTHCENKHRYLNLRSKIRRGFENVTIPKLNCFNIMDPDSLYDTL